MSLSPFPEAIPNLGAIPLFFPSSPTPRLLSTTGKIDKVIPLIPLQINSSQTQGITCIPLPYFCSHFLKQMDALVSYREQRGSAYVTTLNFLPSKYKLMYVCPNHYSPLYL